MESLRRRPAAKFFYSPITGIILFVVLILVGQGVYKVYLKYSRSKQEYQSAQRQLDAVRTRREELTRRVDRLKTEKGIEEEYRRNFNVAAPGEVLIVFPEDQNKSAPGVIAEKSWWQKLKELF